MIEERVMTKFVGIFPGGEYVNIPADAMDDEGDFLRVWREGELVGLFEKTTILAAYLSAWGKQK